MYRLMVASRAVLVVLALSWLGPLEAAEASPLHRGEAALPLDRRAMESFVDRYLAEQMSVHHVAGAAVAVVHGDEVVLSKGYGFADVARQVPVDPEKTVFVLGSLSKVFTWTAVMQLVENGQLDLAADVNRYLDFEIPATHAQPITLDHLMAHSAGFDDEKFGQMSAPSAPRLPLGEWLKARLPARSVQPGRLSAYANYGAALAGYVVERVSGTPYDDYVERRILAPLGMARTTSRQPLPATLASDASRCYRFEQGQYVPQPITDAILLPAPAGAFRASARDVALFMMAHLNDGRLGEATLLQPATARLMHERSFGHDPRVNGMAHGFWELDVDGQEVIGHAGSHFVAGSLLLLFPRHRLGVFVVTNSEGGNVFVGGNYFPFLRRFVAHCFPKTVAPVTARAGAAERARRASGRYRLTMGRAERSPEKLFSLVMGVGVAADGDGVVVGLPSGPERFVETEPFVFRQEDGDTLVVFHEDGSGSVSEAFYGLAPLTALVRYPWYEAPALHLTLVGACVVLFSTLLLVAPVRFAVRRWRGVTTAETALGRRARLLGLVTSAASLAVLAAAVVSLFDVVGLYLGALPLWNVVRFGSFVLVPLACTLALQSVMLWKRRCWSAAARVHHTLVAAAAFAFLWFLYCWNLLGRGL